MVPMLAAVHFVESRHERAVRDRHRADGLFRLALSVHELTDTDRIAEHVTAASPDMLLCERAELRDVPPGPDEIGAAISVTESAPLWLVASHPLQRNARWGNEAEYLLKAIASITQSALRTAELIERIRWQGTHDDRTGLPNQVLFEDRVEQAIQRAQRDKEHLAVLCLNVDGFRRVNESYGFEAGDGVLVEFARRLQGAVREIDTVARMSADQFVILLPSVGTAAAIGTVTERVIASINTPLTVGATDVFLTSSVGVATFPEHGVRPGHLLRNAESAMHKVKHDGGNALRLYSPEMNEFAHLRLSRESELHAAIERGELTLRYQPFIELATGRTIGVEALVRWEHPVHGLLYPDEFVPLAEESGLILALDAYVLRVACFQAVSWSAAGLPPLRVACNLSGRHFYDDHVIRLVEQTLEETRLAPDRLELEITERIALRDGATASDLLKTLRQMGVSLSIDDFGTGYSALSQLQKLAVDRLKVDRSFVSQITGPNEPAPLVTAFLAMARALNLGVIAEGVETVEQRDFLVVHGCDEAQGYLFAKPQLAEVLASMVRQEMATPGYGEFHR
jgi:diguanylate cyclase (GGDEF)-like protein